MTKGHPPQLGTWKNLFYNLKKTHRNVLHNQWRGSIFNPSRKSDMEVSSLYELFLTQIKFLNKEVFTPKTDLLMISSSKYPRDKLKGVVLI